MSVFAAVFLFSASVSLSPAQHWSADEQSLIDGVRGCWEAVNADITADAVTTHCRPVEGSTYWWTPETAPYYFMSSWTRGIWENWNLKLISQDLRPIRVQIDGDFGFIFFHGIRIYETSDGSRRTESWKGMEVWKRTGDGWSYFAGMGSPDALNQIG